ncbi:hypothetical protein RB195_023606 [Necator americanus]
MDNVTQFTSPQFTSFCPSRGILHTRTPPFYPQSKGQVERFVDTFKRGLAKLKGEEPTVDALQKFQMGYCSTPCPSAPDQRLPAEASLGRRLRTELDLMLPSRGLTNGPRDVKMESQFNRRNGARRRNFEINDAIFAKDYRGQKPTWTPGFITRRVGNTTYTVRCGNEVCTRHVNQLRSAQLRLTLSCMCSTYRYSTPRAGTMIQRRLPTRLNDRNAFDDPVADYRWTHEELDTR